MQPDDTNKTTCEWISVKDRLPNKEDYFLVYHQKYGMNIAWFDYRIRKCFLSDDRYIDADYEVSAEYWAELPPPPEST